MVLQQLAPEAILSVQLLILQLNNYRIIVQMSEVTLIDFCIAPIIAVRLDSYSSMHEGKNIIQEVDVLSLNIQNHIWFHIQAHI